MSVTLDEIAEKAGVSRTTVARALNGKTKQAWSSTARRVQRIQKLAEEMGYRRNTAAVATRSRRFGQIGILTRHEMGPIQHNLNKGVFEAASRHDLNVTYAEVEFEGLTDPDYAPKVLRELCVDGLLVHYGWDIPTTIMDLIRGYGIPTVWLNTRETHDCVYPDDRQGSELATQRLIELGHRRILFAFRPNRKRHPFHYSTQDREQGYVDAMTHHGLKPVVVQIDHQPEDYAERITLWRQILEQHDKSTAVVCQNERVAYPLLVAAALLGRSAPADLSVATVLDTGGKGMPVSGITVPLESVGAQAVDMLTERIRNADASIPSIAVPYQSLSRQTIAALNT